MNETFREIVVATNNRDKISEISQILGDLPISLILPADLKDPPVVEEDGDTFEENAKKKALALATTYNMIAIADDSGICVDALNGRPGVLSARYGGEGINDRERYLLLLREMEGVPADQRTARFVCVICLAAPDGNCVSFRGECEGKITSSPQGEGGFGYDPVFYYEPAGKTFGRMEVAEKNLVSHRRRALNKLKDYLESCD
jgi:XTP/dITP diphosphohydrolase